MAFSLNRKFIFSGFGGPGSALARPLFQVWNQGVFFISFFLISFDLGAIWASLLVSFGLPFRVVFRSCSGFALGLVLGAFGMLFGRFWEPFVSFVGALGPPLGDFWRTLAALGVAFETFVALWAWWVALGKTWKVSRGFLGRFFTLLIDFIIFSMTFWLPIAPE